MARCMGGWEYGWMDRRRAGWMKEGRMDEGRKEGWMDRWKGGRVDGWKDGWMDGRKEGWMDGWMDGCVGE